MCTIKPAVVLLLASALGCGGSSKGGGATAPGSQPGSGSDAADCEPGRCLPDLSKLIQGHRAEARACYDEGQKRQPGIEGRIIINFEIDPTGVVVDASQGMQDNQITEPGVVACIVEIVQNIQFATSATGKTSRAYHRFEFSPGGS